MLNIRKGEVHIERNPALRAFFEYKASQGASEAGVGDIGQQLGNIASKYGKFKCKEAADAMLV